MEAIILPSSQGPVIVYDGLVIRMSDFEGMLSAVDDTPNLLQDLEKLIIEHLTSVVEFSKESFLNKKNPHTKLISEALITMDSFYKFASSEYINYLQKTTEEELKNSIKARVYEAHAISTNIYEKYKDTKTKEEIFELIKIALSSIRFNDGRGYFFIDDIYGNKLSYPIDTEIEGKNFINFTDAKGYKFFESIVGIIKNKSEKFDEYYWYKPNTNKEIGRKISFYKCFEPLNIAIGTGEYFNILNALL